MRCICINQGGTEGAITLKGRTRPVVKVVQKSDTLFIAENVNGLVPDLRANAWQGVACLGLCKLATELFEVFVWVHYNVPRSANSRNGLRNPGARTSGSLQRHAAKAEDKYDQS